MIEARVSQEGANSLNYWFGRPTTAGERAIGKIIYSSIYGER